MIKKHAEIYSTRMMCRLMRVSSSGYYDWSTRKPSLQAQASAALSIHIKRIFDEEKGRAGSKRITKRLNSEGIVTGKNRVADIMRAKQWRAKGKKKYKATTNSDHKLPVAPNLLQQDFSSVRRDEKWVSDITYIWTEEGWLYLATVMDLYSRKIVGWALSDRMTTPLVINALNMALWHRGQPSGVIVHSDRGKQYCAGDYQDLFKKHELICSMSKRGDCYDNAAMESWNHSFKVEAIHGEKFLTREHAKQHIFEYIDVYYNRQRLHSTLGYLSPAQFEEKFS